MEECEHECATLAKQKPLPKDIARKVRSAFEGMMRSLHSKAHGAHVEVGFMKDEKVQSFIQVHTDVLNEGMKTAEMTARMRERLEKSNFIFSGMKTFHELNEAFPSLTDEKGNRKPFERFLNDVQRVDETYNRRYLRAEYNFVSASAEMAGRWEQFERDGDRYHLQYRTVGDSHVREEHASMNGVTLPFSSPFWEVHFPPNGWNCRCTVVQVRKEKYPLTDLSEANRRAEASSKKDTKGMFRFNAGREGKSVPDYNPYTISKCKTCPVAKGKGNSHLAKVPKNELCAACKIVRAMKAHKAKDTKVRARKELQGRLLQVEGFPHKILISRKSIDEWINQPYKFPNEKFEMLFDIDNVLKTSEYMGWVEENKNREIYGSYIFSITVRGEQHVIIARRSSPQDVVLHSISDNPQKILANLHTEGDIPIIKKKR